jgi:hypothetical protein
LSDTKKRGETGCDLIATRESESLFIEIIGFHSVPPIRSREFYELFFRTISRDTGGQNNRLVMALPARFAIGMRRRKQQSGLAWNKSAKPFQTWKDGMSKLAQLEERGIPARVPWVVSSEGCCLKDVPLKKYRSM